MAYVKGRKLKVMDNPLIINRIVTESTNTNNNNMSY